MMRIRQDRLFFAIVAIILFWPLAAMAHDVAQGDKAYVQATHQAAFAPFLYLGAKHMVTGYDHILFLTGVVMFLYRFKDVVLYVSMFTIGHSTTLLLGVLSGQGFNSHLVDAIIGISIVYKGLENLGVLRRWGIMIDARLAVLVFGLFHGMGLASKLLDLSLSPEGLMTNLLGFNLGVELGQIIILFPIVCVLNIWRGSASFRRGAAVTNIILLVCGSLITFDQAARYLQS